MKKLEKFKSLPVDKQNHIINAALTAFGRNGYKKASVNDIAAAAGISKPMVFYYFGTKKAMYMYLAELCGNIIINEIEKNLDKNVTGFFDRIKMISKIKVSTIKQHYGMLSFMKSMYNENDEEVKNDIKNLMHGTEKHGWSFMLDGTDISKLRDDIDPKLLLEFLIWAAEGFSNGLPLDSNADDLDLYVEDFNKCLGFMEKYFYKD